MKRAMANPGRPAAGAPANAALARRPVPEPANNKGDAMLSETYVDNDDLNKNVGDELDDFEARLNGDQRSRAPVAANNAGAKPAAARGAVQQGRAGPPPMGSKAVPARAPGGGARAKPSTGGDDDDDSITDRKRDIEDVASLPDY